MLMQKVHQSTPNFGTVIAAENTSESQVCSGGVGYNGNYVTIQDDTVCIRSLYYTCRPVLYSFKQENMLQLVTTW